MSDAGLGFFLISVVLLLFGTMLFQMILTYRNPATTSHAPTILMAGGYVALMLIGVLFFK
ncbi:MAG TPA: hypothetical protein VN833_16650 [Candidatus Acidoferrales bacterium]|jgi:hypothetical protein|nr:hypothetical protein [Candidatus Acidoferrales bacterium]